MSERKPSNGHDKLSAFVVDVASGDMPTEPVFRAASGKNPAAEALDRMGKGKGAGRAPQDTPQALGEPTPRATRQGS